MAIPGQITGLILVGGSGQRLGSQDKALLRLVGEPLLVHVRRRLEPQTDGILLGIHEGGAGRLAPWCQGCLEVADERHPRQGPLASLEAALRVAPGDWLLSVPVDAPFIPLDLAQRLVAALQGLEQPAIAVNRGRAHPVIALWPRSLLAKISQALDNNDRGLKYFLRHTPHVEVVFPDVVEGVDPFFNINTPEDWQLASQVTMLTGG